MANQRGSAGPRAGTKEYKPEILDTLGTVALNEKLQFNLDITEREYTSTHEVGGELEMTVEPTKKALKDRQSPPMGVLARLAALADKDPQIRGFPGTTLYVAFSEQAEVEENEYDDQMDPTIEGIPEDDTREFDLDWDVDMLEEYLADGKERVLTDEYEIREFPSDRLPIIVRAKLYRDAVELYRKRERNIDDPQRQRAREQQQRQRKNRRARFEGLAALSIALEHREYGSDPDRVLRLNRFRVEMSQTFPDIEFMPEQGSTYNPERKRVEWNSRTSRPGDVTRYIIVGPIEQLLDMGQISAQMEGRITNATLSRRVISDLYDESGKSIVQHVDIEHGVDVECDIGIQPDALSGQVQKKTEATLNVVGLPEEVYSELENICRREGIQIRTQKAPAEAEPAPDRNGVWVVSGKENRGELDVKREYGDRGVVYGTILVTGEYTPSSKDQHVTMSEQGSDDKIVRADEGALESRGRATIEINARSASPELNAEFLETFEDAFPGGEAK